MNRRSLKGAQMGPLLVLVCPCFRENVIVTCKLCLFCVVLIIFFWKKFFFFFFFWKSNFRMALIWKKGYFWPTFHIFQSPGKRNKYSFSTYLTHIHTRILLTLLIFCLTNLAKIMNSSRMVSLWCDSWCWFLFAPFWSNQ